MLDRIAFQLKAKFDQGRNIRREVGPLQFHRREKSHRSALQLRIPAARRKCASRHVPSKNSSRHRRIAIEGYDIHVNSGFAKHRARKDIRHRAGTGNAEREFSRLLAGALDEILEGLDVAVRLDRHPKPLPPNADDRVRAFEKVGSMFWNS